MYGVEDDDGLGYYPDGVRRTLTDEQIAIFRHTEIQTLLRERRKSRAADTYEDQSRPGALSQVASSPILSPDHEPHPANQFESIRPEVLVKSMLQPPSGSQPESQPESNESNEAAVENVGDADSDIYFGSTSCNQDPEATSIGSALRKVARHPELSNQQRKNLNRRRKRKKQQKEERRLRQRSEAKTPRRKAREMDEQDASQARLNYDAEALDKDGDAVQVRFTESDDLYSNGKVKGDEICEPESATSIGLKPSREEPNRTFLWPQIKSDTSGVDC